MHYVCCRKLKNLIRHRLAVTRHSHGAPDWVVANLVGFWQWHG